MRLFIYYKTIDTWMRKKQSKICIQFQTIRIQIQFYEDFVFSCNRVVRGTSRNNKKLIPPRVTTPRNQGEGSKACDCTKVPIDSKIRKISKKEEEEEEEEEINGGEIKDRGGGGKSRRGVERIVEQEEADVIKRVVSETRPGGNGYPYSYNLLRFQGVDRSSCLRNTRCILIIRTSMTVRATLNYRVLLRFPSPLSLSFLSSSSRPLQL